MLNREFVIIVMGFFKLCKQFSWVCYMRSTKTVELMLSFVSIQVDPGLCTLPAYMLSMILSFLMYSKLDLYMCKSTQLVSPCHALGESQFTACLRLLIRKWQDASCAISGSNCRTFVGIVG